MSDEPVLTLYIFTLNINKYTWLDVNTQSCTMRASVYIRRYTKPLFIPLSKPYILINPIKRILIPVDSITINTMASKKVNICNLILMKKAYECIVQPNKSARCAGCTMLVYVSCQISTMLKLYIYIYIK